MVVTEAPLALPGSHLPPELANASTLDLVKSHLPLGRFELVPVDLITMDGAIIDEAKVANVARSLSQPRGQAEPVSVRVREAANPAGLAYDTIDGYHRHAAALRLGWKFLEGKVQYGCGDEEYNDLRILAANPEGPVVFARTASWMQGIYVKSPWGDSGLRVDQAFGIATGHTKVSRLATNLTPADIRGLRLWCQDKCRTWDRQIGSVYSVLRIAANADPELVEKTRNMAGGRARTTVINPTRLKIVVDRFPKEEYFPAQRAILRSAVGRGLYTHQVMFLVQEAAQLVRPGMAEDEVYRLVQDIRAEEVEKPNISSRALALSVDSPTSELSPQYVEMSRQLQEKAARNVSLEEQLLQARKDISATQAEADTVRSENTRLKEELAKVAALPAKPDEQTALNQLKSTQRELASVASQLAQAQAKATQARLYEDHITQLQRKLQQEEAARRRESAARARLEQVVASLSSASGKAPTPPPQNSHWWHAGGFSDLQKRVLDSLILDGIGLTATAIKVGLPGGPREAFEIVGQAFTKHRSA